MKQACLASGLAERAGLPVLSIGRNDGERFNYIDWSLASLDALGYLGTCAHIGRVTLKMLYLAHPELFNHR